MLHQAAPLPRNRGPRPANRISTTLRFAFYGRISTARFQDPISSREWQLEFAAGVVGGSEHITVEFFDTACSRTLPWHDRPQASALLEAAAQPDRAFDAVVKGEVERGFGHGQAQAIIAQLNAFGVAVWMPEFDGTVDLGDPTHRALLMMLGHQARREILRSRRRTTTAMYAQARLQGRHLGGRPPYGYRLVDAGPHPNAAHAQWGRRLQLLDPDLDAAPPRAVDLR